MTTPRRLVAAAPAWVAAALAGPSRTVPVVHTGPDATYVDLSDTVLGVLSARATVVPCGLRTTERNLPAEVCDAREGVLGGGRLRLGSVEVACTRTVESSVPRRPRADLDRLEERLSATLWELPAVTQRLDAVRAEVGDEALAGLAGGRTHAAGSLLGRGSGLTPVGDDVLCGWLAARVWAGTDVEPVRSLALDLAAHRTTALSATLVACAARGEVLPQFRRVLLALDDDGGGPAGDGRLRTALTDLVQVGHTSGAGLLLGADLALRFPASRSQTR